MWKRIVMWSVVLGTPGFLASVPARVVDAHRGRLTTSVEPG
jgi:hypothetical protein